MNVCASPDSFGAYSVSCDGIYAAGDTIEECKRDTERAIALMKENMPEESLPEAIRGEYKLVWHYDIQSLLLHYGSILSLAGLERLTGVRQEQLWAFMNGRQKPRTAQKRRIEDALHSFGGELKEVCIL